MKRGKQLLVSALLTTVTAVYAAEPFYVSESAEKVDAMLLGNDIGIIGSPNHTGAVIDDVRENDFINYLRLSDFSSSNYRLELDNNFANSRELDLNTITGKVTLKTPLIGTSSCAIPRFKFTPSACLRYKVCSLTGTTVCKTAYAVTYEAVTRNVFVYSGAERIVISTSAKGVYEIRSGATNLILPPQKEIKGISKGYNNDHYFLILSDDTILGSGNNDNHQINYYDPDTLVYSSSYNNGRFGKIGPYSSRLTSRRYTCYYSRNKAPKKWKTIATYKGGTIGVVADDKAAYGWGSNRRLQFGRGLLYASGGVYDVDCPHKASLLAYNKFVSLSVGHAHALGLTESGDVYRWGKDEKALMPRAQPINRYQRPAKIDELTEPHIAIEAGNGFSVVLSESGVVQTFGTDPNNLGLLGRLPDTSGNRPSIAEVVFTDNSYTANKIISISAEVENAIAIDDQGYVWVWGKEFLANGTNQINTTPVRVKDANGNYFVASHPEGVNVYAGANYQLIQSGNRLYAWGSNANGVLGDKIPTTGADHPVLIFEKN